MKVELGKQYKTLDGHNVRILCLDRKSDGYPVVALIQDENGYENCHVYTPDGYYLSQAEAASNPLDLVEYDPVMDLKVDQPIWVRDTEHDCWVVRHFARYENGLVYAWFGGRTSFTTSDTTVWRYFTAEKP